MRKLNTPAMLSLCGLVAVVCSPAALGQSEPIMYAHFIDVGQADATLLEFPCGAILIDAGAQDDAHIARLMDYLDFFFDGRPDLKRTLDSVIITHNHIDHTRALRAVVENFTVERYIDNGQLEGPGTANPKWVRRISGEGDQSIIIREIADTQITDLPQKTGLTGADIDPVTCDDCDPEIRILSGRLDENPGWPHPEFDNKNNHSLVIRVDFGESSLLFTGDLEEDAIETLVLYYEDTDLLDVDIYQVGRHGSHNGTTASLLQAMTPEIAVISMGNWHYGRDDHRRFTTLAYGHPRRVLLDLLSVTIPRERPSTLLVHAAEGPRDFRPYEVRKEIYGTGWEGMVRLQLNLDGSLEALHERAAARPNGAPDKASPEEDDDDLDYKTVRVFYGTNRKRTGQTEPHKVFGHEPVEIVELGVCEVSIPDRHEPGELESPGWFLRRWREDPAKHVVLLKVDRLERAAFYETLRGAIGTTNDRHAFVFIHGFNTEFEEAARRTAQLAYDLRVDGAAMMYSWPSKHRLLPSRTHYNTEEENVRVAMPRLRQFLETVVSESGASQVSVLAHSMGNRALTYALVEIARQLSGDPDPPFHQVILLAPDINATIFKEQIAPHMLQGAADRVTLYASSKDRLLEISEKWHTAPRAGDSGNGLVVLARLDTIDVSAVDTSLLGHSYFGPALIDIRSLIRFNTAPKDRRLDKRSRYGLPYWALKENDD